MARREDDLSQLEFNGTIGCSDAEAWSAGGYLPAGGLPAGAVPHSEVYLPLLVK